MKVVERGEKCAIILVSQDGATFAVCPVKEGAVDRCVDSSRYFVLRIENAQGRHMFIGENWIPFYTNAVYGISSIRQ